MRLQVAACLDMSNPAQKPPATLISAQFSVGSDTEKNSKMESKRTKQDIDVFKLVVQALYDMENKPNALLDEYMEKAENLKKKVQQFNRQKKTVSHKKKTQHTLETVIETHEEDNKEEEDKKKRGRKRKNATTKASEVTKAPAKGRRTRRGNKRKSSDSPSPEQPRSKSARKEESVSAVTSGENMLPIKECTVVLKKLDSSEIPVHATLVLDQSNSSKDKETLKAECTPPIKKTIDLDKKTKPDNSEAELKDNTRSQTQMKMNEKNDISKNIHITEANNSVSDRKDSPVNGRRSSGRRKSTNKSEEQVKGSPSFKKPLPVEETFTFGNAKQRDGSSQFSATDKPSPEQSNSTNDDTEDKTVNSKKGKKKSKRRKGKSKKANEGDRTYTVSDIQSKESPKANVVEKLPEEQESAPVQADSKPVASQRVTRSKRRKEPSNVPTGDGDIVSSSGSDNEKQTNDPPATTVTNPNTDTSAPVQGDDKPVISQRVTRSKQRKETSNMLNKNGGPAITTTSSGSEEDNPKKNKTSTVMKAQLLKHVTDKFTPINIKEKENHFIRQMKTGEKSTTKSTPLKNHNSFIPVTKFKTPVYSSAKLKIATIEEAERRRKEEEANRKKLKEEEALRNRNERLKAKQEDIRRRNEEKMQKVAAFREAANKETEERQAKMEEEKRKEEELRLRNLKEMERLKKQRLEEQRLKEAQEKKAKELMKAKANIIPLKDKDNYDIADITPDDDDCNDEDNIPKKEIPLWAKKGEEKTRHEIMQSFVPMEVVADFFACPGQTPDLTQFFGKMTMKRVRTSSAVWFDTPPLKKF